MRRKNQSHLADLTLLIIAVIWGTGFIATEYAIRAGLATSFMMSVRFLLAAVCMLPYALKRLKRAGKHTLIRGTAAGAILCAAFYAQTHGQSQTSVSNSAFLTATNVVMVPFIVWGITKKRPKAKTYILAFMTLVGVWVLTMRANEPFAIGAGDAYVLISAVLFAIHIAFLGTYTKNDDAGMIAFMQFVSAGVIATLVMLIWEPGALTAGDLRTGLWPLLFLGCFSTCLCFFLQTWAQQRTTPAKAGLLLSTEGLFGSLLSVLLGLEVFRINLLTGGLIILLCVLLAEIDWPLMLKRKQ